MAHIVVYHWQLTVCSYGTCRARQMYVGSAKYHVVSAKCHIGSAKCHVGRAKCRVGSAKWYTDIAEYR